MRQYEKRVILCNVRVVKHKITAAGQVSIPAEVRRRWDTNTVYIEDNGDHLVVRPRPSNPAATARGVLKGKGRRNVTTAELRRIAREDERRADERKERLWSSSMRSR